MDPLVLVVFLVAQGLGRLVEVLLQVRLVQNELHARELILKSLTDTFPTVGNANDLSFLSQTRDYQVMRRRTFPKPLT